MDKKNNGRDHNVVKKQNSKRNQPIRKDMIKQDNGERDSSRIEERQWNCLYE